MKPIPEKLFAAVAIAAFSTLAIAFGSVGVMSHAVPPAGSELSDSVRAASTPSVPATGSSSSVRTAGLAVAKLTVHTSFRGQSVSASDLDSLAVGAKLDSGALQHMEKASWAKELPIAENMLQGICDCEERNWINHFIEAAKLALAGSSDYYKSVAVLDQLPRDNQELNAAVAGE